MTKTAFVHPHEQAADALFGVGDIPRGDTCEGVNRLILEYLATQSGVEADLTLLDIPCGRGEFLGAVRRAFPHWRLIGADIAETSEVGDYMQVDASDPQLEFGHGPFDVITCISGVMEFANHLAFFKNLRRSIRPSGNLLVTNDNLLTVRDRLLYLLFGRFGQYPRVLEPGLPTWKVTPLQNLIRVLSDAGFDVGEVVYVPVRPKNWLWLPVAIPIYALERLTSSGSSESKYFPFLSLLSRHYLLICRPR